MIHGQTEVVDVWSSLNTVGSLHTGCNERKDTRCVCVIAGFNLVSEAYLEAQPRRDKNQPLMAPVHWASDQPMIALKACHNPNCIHMNLE